MKKNSFLIKILAIVGTVLLWLPILAPVLIFISLIIQENKFLFDYLMPLEFFFIALAGGVLLLLAALIAHSHRKLIGWCFGLFGALRLVVFAATNIRGILSGENDPAEWMNIVLIILSNVYTIALIALGISGILLLAGLFRRKQPV